MTGKSRFFGNGHDDNSDHHGSWHDDGQWGDDNGGDDNGDDDGGDDNGHDHGGGNPSAQFHFDLPTSFKVNLNSLDLKSLGKVTNFDVEDNLISVTLGHKWTFEITGSDLDITVEKGKLPTIDGGTISSFSIDGPGKADFSISGLDIDAKDFVKAVTHLDATKLLSMVLGGDETISGSGYSDLLYGGKGDDTLLGNKGVDELMGGAGNDVLNGGQQSDLLIGGAGADRFVFEAKSGMDLILDFDPNSDKLDLTALGFSSLDDVLPGQGHGWHGGEDDKHGHGDAGRCWQQSDHGDVVLDLGDGNMVKLFGVSASELNSDNVLI